MESIMYTAKPLKNKKFRIFKRILELKTKITRIESHSYSKEGCSVHGKEKQYYAYGKPINTGIITKNPKDMIFALIKKDEHERRIKKTQQ